MTTSITVRAATQDELERCDVADSEASLIDGSFAVLRDGGLIAITNEYGTAVWTAPEVDKDRAEIFVENATGLWTTAPAIPLDGVSMRDRWKPGEPVELVSYPDGPYKPAHLRPGEVVSIDEELRRHERLKVRFDDGEERYINPDVMRHRREENKP